MAHLEGSGKGGSRKRAPDRTVKFLHQVGRVGKKKNEKKKKKKKWHTKPRKSLISDKAWTCSHPAQPGQRRRVSRLPAFLALARQTWGRMSCLGSWQSGHGHAHGRGLRGLTQEIEKKTSGRGRGDWRDGRVHVPCSPGKPLNRLCTPVPSSPSRSAWPMRRCALI